MKRLVGALLISLPVLTAGCQALGIGVSPSGQAARVPGQWQKTVIGIQKYNNAVLRDKATGKVLDTVDLEANPKLADITVEAGDIEELTYRAGRLRYSFTAPEKDAQPYVVERPIDEKEFEALDAAIYQDKFFTFGEKNWATERAPLYYVQYDQGGKGWKASFTPNLNRLLKTQAIVNPYLAQLSGQAKAPVGAKQYAYYLVPKSGQLHVSISSLAANAGGEAEDRPWTIKAASYDTGKGFQTATVDAGGAGFSLPLPAGDGNLQLVGLKVTAEGDPGTWETLIPVRTTTK